MKKLFYLVLLFIFLFPFTIKASSEQVYGKLYYRLENNEIVITRSDLDISGDVIIPATINGVKVKRIGDNAFFKRDNVTSVVILKGVEVIGDGSFSMMKNLKSVKLPDSIKVIHDGAFAWCDNLSEINLPDSIIEIGDAAFAYNPRLVSVVLPKKLKKLGSTIYAEPGTIGSFGVFEYCENLVNVVLPSSLETIGYGALAYTKISSLVLPSSLTTIGDNALQNIKSLKSLTIPNNVKYFGKNVLANTDVTLNVGSNSPALNYVKANNVKYKLYSGSAIGDLNSNSKVDLTDVLLILKLYFGNIKLNDDYKIVGDLNVDTKVNLTDVLMLLKKYFEVG